MKESTDTDQLLKKLYRRLQQLQQENSRLKQDRRSAIAVIGIGCRLPCGVDSLGQLSHQLRAGRPWHTGDMSARLGEAGGDWQSPLVQDVDQFDPDFFSISEQEAAELDPQQRLLLETAYWSLADAGYTRAAVKGQPLGVFVGMSSDDYQLHTIASGGDNAINGFNTLGTARSVAAGRIAYSFDLRGPAMQVDTACSSSLMAVHLACQSLQRGDATMALAGGVNLLLSEETFATREALGALSSRGRCQTFSDCADGYARSEGCAMLLLKPLAEARADGDRIQAVIHASVANHDGRSNGLTAPSGRAQRELLESLLRQAGREPGEIDYVETHGTGTRLGDPIELHAIGDVLARERGTPLRLGALKSQLGHLEAAAGAAAMLRVTAMLKDGHFYPDPPVEERNPLIHWHEYQWELLAAQQPWQRSGPPRLAAINAFGLSGTNVSLLLGDPETDSAPDQPAATHAGPGTLLCVSAPTRAGLIDNLAAWEAALEHSDDLPALLRSSCVHRDHFAQRFTCSGDSADELIGQIRSALRLSPPENGSAKRWRFDFPELALAPAEAGAMLENWLCWPLFQQAIQPLQELLADAGHAPGESADLLLQYGLATTWRNLGLQPEYLCASGRGALAAALFAEILTPQQLSQWLDGDTAPGTLATGRYPILWAGSDTPTKHARIDDIDAARHRSIAPPPAPADCAVLALATRPATADIVAFPETADLDSWLQRGFNRQLGLAYRLGASLDWSRIYPQSRRQTPTAPNFAFQRRRLWTRASRRDSDRPPTQPTAYERQWQAVAGAANPTAASQLVLLLPERLPPGSPIAEWQSRAEIECLRAGALDPDRARALAQRWPDGFSVVDLRCYHTDPQDYCPERAAALLQQVIASVQQLLPWRARYHLCLPLADGADADGDNLYWSPLRACLRTASHEHPEHIGSLLYCAEQQLTQGLAQLPQWPDFECLWLDGGQLRAERLLPAAPPAPEEATAKAPQAVWIVGGLGGLGQALARSCARQGVRQLVLSGRRNRVTPDTAKILDELRRAGLEIAVESLDITDAAAVEHFASRFGRDLPAVTAVVHAAGTSALCDFRDLDADAIQRICAAKIAGAWNLHRLGEHYPFEHFVLYSSISSVWGSAGLAHYAAANGFLDGLVHLRQRRGLPAVGINWGPWAEVGMAATGELPDTRAWGLQPMPAASLEPWLQAIWQRPQWQQLVCDLVPDTFRAALEARHRVPLLSPLFGEQVATGDAPAAPAPEVLPFSELRGKARSQAISGTVEEHVRKVLKGQQPARFDRRQPLQEMGIDSLMAVDVTSTLSAFFGVKLPATLIFDYPSAGAIADFIESSFYPQTEAEELTADERAALSQMLRDMPAELMEQIDEAS